VVREQRVPRVVRVHMAVRRTACSTWFWRGVESPAHVVCSSSNAPCALAPPPSSDASSHGASTPSSMATSRLSGPAPNTATLPCQSVFIRSLAQPNSTSSLTRPTKEHPLGHSPKPQALIRSLAQPAKFSPSACAHACSWSERVHSPCNGRVRCKCGSLVRGGSSHPAEVRTVA
jgi:hypothetical protein